jgi:hypothetical protein
MKKVLRIALLFVLSALTVLSISCSSMGPPPATGGAGCERAAKTPGYPTVGCGTDVGTVIDNLLFTGKDAGNGGVSAPKQIFCLGAAFYDPTGKDASKRFLVLSVATPAVASKENSTSFSPDGDVTGTFSALR